MDRRDFFQLIGVGLMGVLTTDFLAGCGSNDPITPSSLEPAFIEVPEGHILPRVVAKNITVTVLLPIKNETKNISVPVGTSITQLASLAFSNTHIGVVGSTSSIDGLKGMWAYAINGVKPLNILAKNCQLVNNCTVSFIKLA